MSRLCSICQRADRASIDAALASGAANRRIAAQYGLSEQAIRRHKADHLAASLVKAAEQQDISEAIDVTAQLKAANALAWEIATAAKKAKDGLMVLKALDRILRQLELVAELTEILDRRPRINVLISSEWQSTRAALFAALLPYPEARLAVASRLVNLEALNANSI